MKVLAIRKRAIESLNSKFSEREARYLVDLLIEFVLEIDKSKLLIGDVSINENQTALLDEYILRLKNDEPIQHILQEDFFYGMPFKVTKDVLIPRPETEELVEWILEDGKLKNDLQILDIGTGSGCIAIALKTNLPNSEVHAIDVSENALKIAQENALNLGVDINFKQLDILNNENWSQLDTYDIIVSNPPYIPHKEKALMHNNVLQYEPSTALFVQDDDALIFYQKIAQLTIQHLNPKGALYFECNEYNALEVEALLKKHFQEVDLKKDINGKLRMVKGATFLK